jgi:hypothetical protein
MMIIPLSFDKWAEPLPSIFIFNMVSTTVSIKISAPTTPRSFPSLYKGLKIVTTTFLVV